MTIHGLRPTFSSLAKWLEMPVAVVKFIGHKPNATTEKHSKTRPQVLLAIWHGKNQAWTLSQLESSLNLKLTP